MTYAENTTVSVARSKMELDTLLQKHGAGQRAFADDDEGGKAVVVFALQGRQYRLEVPLPKLEEFKTRKVKGRYYPVDRSKDEQAKAHEQACRARWRAVVLLVKAKLELVAMGVSTVEREFLADLLLPNGARVHAAIAKDIEQTYLEGKMPKLLLGMGER